MCVRTIALAGALCILLALMPEHIFGCGRPPAAGQYAAAVWLTLGSGRGAEPGGAATQVQAASSQPTPPADGGAERRLSAGPIVGLIVAFLASTIALGVAFGVRRRIDRIAGPDPEQDDD